MAYFEVPGPSLEVRHVLKVVSRLVLPVPTLNLVRQMLDSTLPSPGSKSHCVERVKQHGKVMILVLGHVQPQLLHADAQVNQGLGEVQPLGVRYPGQISGQTENYKIIKYACVMDVVVWVPT